MKLTVKTLQQKSIQLDVEPSETILNVKQKLNESEGFSVESQKLIYSGKILNNEQTLETLNFKESEFMVVMVTKPKPSSNPVASSSSTPTVTSAIPAPVSTTTSSSLAAAITAPPPASSSPTVSPAAAPSSTSSAPAPQISVSGDTSFATGAVYETAVANMIEMGFPRDQVVQAMRAAFNNPDRAVDYLMNGIPEDLRPPSAAAVTAAPTTTSPSAPVPHALGTSTAPTTSTLPTSASPPTAPATASQNLFNLAQLHNASTTPNSQLGSYSVTSPTSPTSTSSTLPPDLSELANHPQFDQLRQMVQANPQLLQPILQQMIQTHPQLMEYISNHQEEFLQLLLQPTQGAHGMEEVEIPRILLPEEKDAIDRLVALGFEFHAAIEAYFACDKNEEMAANYLFENQFD
ncbi:hypothetical protein HMI54_015568 [Coelomomyces lativittatus]|nr:hypothetical protein HMI56_006753 [Coelomomyces lativittatus]KAJ1512679.1 hypothetical protein HMI54_015568 [Coelomomyces lativittatus]KAJ1518052.1 hypothetical protein HMI55_003558 [Coelomomyces lativittatus]